jgi:hypothetical protein
MSEATPEVVGAAPHHFQFSLGNNRIVTVESYTHALRAAVTTATRGSVAVSLGEAELSLPLNQIEFGDLDVPTETLEWLGRLTSNTLLLTGPPGARAAYGHTHAKLGFPLGYSFERMSATGIFVPIARPMQPSAIDDFPPMGHALRPLINCAKDDAYVQVGEDIYLIPRSPMPITLDIATQSIETGPHGIPITTGYVQSLGGLAAIQGLRQDAILLVYSDVLRFINQFAPHLADRVVCGGDTKRGENGSQLPIIQSLLRVGPKTIQRAARIGF